MKESELHNMTKWDLFEVCKTGENSKINQYKPPYK